jgi:receptor protein-tyrosine kinase
MSTIEKAAARIAARQKAGAVAQSDRGRNGDRDEGQQASQSPAAHVVARRRHLQSLEPAGPGAFFDIDLDDIRERGYITPDIGRSQLAQEMRRIKRPLLLNIQRAQAKGEAEGPPANLIMVTSALPGEGKTFVALNLAMSMAAEVDRRVLLVDADVARGDLSGQLGIADRRGLSDVLQETSYLAEDGVLISNVDRLSVLPAGSQTDHVDELFASGLMAVVSKALADADPGRIVIFDASPLLATTEAAVLAQRMGQTLLVVEANKTPQDAVGQALGLLEGCSNVSVMLNKATGGDASGYSYGYGYGYGEGAQPANRYGRKEETV